MSDIAKELGITKGALYKHYTSKQEILNSIVERMNKMDYERAEEYEMPESEPDGFCGGLSANTDRKDPHIQHGTV